MYLSKRAAFMRNIAASAINGIITLILLLIAPLGLASVISNTFLVALSTLIVCSICDLLVAWLSFSTPSERFIRQKSDLSHWPKSREIERRRIDRQ